MKRSLLLNSITDGAECSFSKTDKDWYGVVLKSQNVDSEILSSFLRFNVEYKDGNNQQQWIDRCISSELELVLVKPNGSSFKQKLLTKSKLITGFCTIDNSSTHQVLWSEKHDGLYKLYYFSDNLGSQDKTKDFSRGYLIAVSENPILNPTAINITGNKNEEICENLCIALQVCVRGIDYIKVISVPTDSTSKPVGFDKSQQSDIDCCNEIVKVEGRNPTITSHGDYGDILVFEHNIGQNNVIIEAIKIQNGQKVGAVIIPPVDDINYRFDTCDDYDNNELYIVFEACPAWGQDELINRNRRICITVVNIETMYPVYGKTGIIVAIPNQTIYDGSTFNRTPIRPKIILSDGKIAVFFRWHRDRLSEGANFFGWDIYCILWDDGRWNNPFRLTHNYGPSDRNYSIIKLNNSILGYFPVFEQTPIIDWDYFSKEKAFDDKPLKGCLYCTNLRLEMWEYSNDIFNTTKTLYKQQVPIKTYNGTTFYTVKKAQKKVVVDPPQLQTPFTKDMKLIWGDTHQHSEYSKCMSINDGSPVDVLCYQRDVLKCDVLTLTEHVEYINFPEYTHVFDSLEKECRDYYIPLYGFEWAKYPGENDTNFYAIDRITAQKLRIYLAQYKDRMSVYDKIKQNLPKGSVYALRHYHGRYYDNKLKAKLTPNFQQSYLNSFDSDLEVAMEAMQTRGNIMLELKNDGYFPNPYLDNGVMVGLVGGTDHSRGGRIFDGIPNNFCLTGFWVKEYSVKGVFDSILNRQTIAVSNGKIAAYACLEDTVMGGQCTQKSPVRIKCYYSSGTPVKQAFLIRDSKIINSKDIPSKGFTSEMGELDFVDSDVLLGNHWYSVGFKGDSKCWNAKITAHCSPIFITIK